MAVEILVRSIFFSFFLSFIVILSADKLLLKHNVYDVYLQVKARYLLIIFEKDIWKTLSTYFDFLFYEMEVGKVDFWVLLLFFRYFFREIG